MDYRAVRITVASLLTGLMIGAVGSAFRILLSKADDLRYALVVWAHAWPYLGWLAPVALGIIGAVVARLMVARFAPEAEGSGVQRVEATFAGEVKPMLRASIILPVKFFGGFLAIGSGLALGREGPTVQMGASLSGVVSGLLVKQDEDRRVIEAAGAGAGLAVAFNAPIGGSVFVFEELTSSFTPWLLVATLAATTFAVWIMRLILGNHFDFMVRQVSLTTVWEGWPFLVLGLLLGAGGALYNSTIIGLLRLCDRFARVSSVQRAALIGAVVGLVGWFAPAMIGGGDNLTQAILTQRFTTAALAGIFLLRFAIGPWSYAAGCPGGLFAPMLVVGASFGALFGEVLNHFLPALGITPFACAVVGMAALFTACVRAPLTGIVLAVEMTGRGDLTLPLLSASLMAMLITMMLDSEPIYETLKRRMLERQAKGEGAIAARRAGIELSH
ncbi:H(+)/Cl(-) exchange transporter ClcA [Edaphobacter aggregans]|uniref:H(+)/Cl(-) exchange transporter ClcA n=1 Tax=Edaphobacter aggregans TaxID=570835 RepID=UPI001B80743A|nr:H(+)/Cl(-) exchange transporter ClcA [Edaphobacter aggregans]